MTNASSESMTTGADNQTQQQAPEVFGVKQEKEKPEKADVVIVIEEDLSDTDEDEESEQEEDDAGVKDWFNVESLSEARAGESNMSAVHQNRECTPVSQPHSTTMNNVSSSDINYVSMVTDRAPASPVEAKCVNTTEMSSVTVNQNNCLASASSEFANCIPDKEKTQTKSLDCNIASSNASCVVGGYDSNAVSTEVRASYQNSVCSMGVQVSDQSVSQSNYGVHSNPRQTYETSFAQLSHPSASNDTPDISTEMTGGQNVADIDTFLLDGFSDLPDNFDAMDYLISLSNCKDDTHEMPQHASSNMQQNISADLSMIDLDLNEITNSAEVSSNTGQCSQSLSAHHTGISHPESENSRNQSATHDSVSPMTAKSAGSYSQETSDLSHEVVNDDVLNSYNSVNQDPLLVDSQNKHHEPEAKCENTSATFAFQIEKTNQQNVSQTLQCTKEVTCNNENTAAVETINFPQPSCSEMQQNAPMAHPQPSCSQLDEEGVGPSNQSNDAIPAHDTSFSYSDRGLKQMEMFLCLSKELKFPPRTLNEKTFTCFACKQLVPEIENGQSMSFKFPCKSCKPKSSGDETKLACDECIIKMVRDTVLKGVSKDGKYTSKSLTCPFCQTKAIKMPLSVEEWPGSCDTFVFVRDVFLYMLPKTCSRAPFLKVYLPTRPRVNNHIRQKFNLIKVPFWPGNSTTIDFKPLKNT